MEILKGQTCPVCLKKSLELSEDEKDIPYFEKIYLFSMKCSDCDFSKSDLESEDNKGPSSYSFTVESKEDLKVRIVKSGSAKIKFPSLRTNVEPAEASEGYVSNVEGIIKRFEDVLTIERDNADDPSAKKTAKNLLKKLWKVKLGELTLKIVIEDPTGNSAIVSKKAELKKIKA
tara:strand:- start:628 stop:1149 length:522 start_codon:yes stop_codon:yes gene_type:complete